MLVHGAFDDAVSPRFSQCICFQQKESTKFSSVWDKSSRQRCNTYKFKDQDKHTRQWCKVYHRYKRWRCTTKWTKEKDKGARQRRVLISISSARQACQDKGARQGFKTREQGIGFESTRKTRGKTAVQDKWVVMIFKGAWHSAATHMSTRQRCKGKRQTGRQCRATSADTWMKEKFRCH